MSYLVIARKYRPQTFASVLGQEHVTLALFNSIARSRIPHALLFAGPRGVGKTTTARVFAKAINCTHADLSNDTSSVSVEPYPVEQHLVEPCGVCNNCIEIAKSSSLAVWEMDGASRNGVDDVRDLIDSLASLPPPGSKYKIYIIDEVHMLSLSAFNALLKSLEEPPPRTIFIFATTEPHKIPATVLSRCQRYDFRNVPDTLVFSSLKDISRDLAVDIAEDVLWLIVRRTSGALRDAQSSLDRLIGFATGKIDITLAETVFGVMSRGFFFDLSRSVFNKNIDNSLGLLNKAYSRSLDLRTFLSDYVSHWRALMIISLYKGQKNIDVARAVELTNLTNDEVLCAMDQIGAHSSFDIRRMFEFAEKAASLALSSSFSKYILEASLIKMASIIPTQELSEVIARIEKFFNAPNALEVGKVNEHVKSNNEVRPFEQSLSWSSFIEFVKDRKLPLLSSHLERIKIIEFYPALLKISGAKFDISSLSEAGNLSSLKRLLYEFSKIDAWKIHFDEDSLSHTKGSIQKNAQSHTLGNTRVSSQLSVKADLVASNCDTLKTHSQTLPIRVTAIVQSEKIGISQSEEELDSSERDFDRVDKQEIDSEVERIMSAFEGSRIEIIKR